MLVALMAAFYLVLPLNLEVGCLELCPSGLSHLGTESHDCADIYVVFYLQYDHWCVTGQEV